MNRMRLRQKRPRLKLDPKEYAIVRTRVLEHDDVIDNLITLCVGCHGKCHGGRR